MPTYGLKYQSTFDPVGHISPIPIYTLEILQKDFTGAAINVMGGDVPVVHQYQTDDPKAVIKGSSLNITLVNDGGLALDNFYSVDDDEFEVRFSFTSVNTFSGTANAIVSEGGGGKSLISLYLTGYNPLISLNSLTITLNGITYNIIQILPYSDRLDIFVTGAIIGSYPASTFSILYTFATVLFEGFLVQDDCSETMVDFTHYINLSANDGLGLLKNITLDKAPANYVPILNVEDTYSSVAPNTLIFSPSLANQLEIGDLINIITLVSNVTYTVAEILGAPDIVVLETVGSIAGPISAQIIISRSSLLDKITVAAVINSCLLATGLTLNTKLWFKIYEETQNAANNFMLQTLIDPQSFISGTQEVVLPVGNFTELNYQQLYDDCYTVLTKILGRFNMTLFQANGVWNIVRWDELRNYNNALVADTFDSNFNSLGKVAMPAPFVSGAGELTYPESGLLRKIFRPYLNDLETFNYKQPALLLRNYDLQTLGALLRTYTVTIWTTTDGVIHYSDPGLGGGPGVIVSFQTWSEYVAPWWYYEDAEPSPKGVNGAAVYFIRIIFDNVGSEIDRYMVVKNNQIHSYKVEANQHDIFTFSFSFQTPDKDWTGAVFQIIVKLNNGTTVLYPKAPTETGATLPGWGPGTGFMVNISSDTKNSFFGVSIQSQGIPFDGLLTFYLQTQSLDASDETRYKDIKLEYTPLVNNSSRINGQTHNSYQLATIKQSGNEEIFIDSSPRNSITGTLFLNQMNGLLQKRCGKWLQQWMLNSQNLGQIITFEELFWRRIARTILDGTFYGLIQSGVHLSMLTVMNYTFFPSLNFVFGSLEIDYKNNKAKATLWEMWNGSGIPSYIYSFVKGPIVGGYAISGVYDSGEEFEIVGTGESDLPPGSICARQGSIVATNVIVTQGSPCGTYTGERDSDLNPNYLFNYLYSAL